jgi:2-oxoglutarate ferredoxin oxidoreductase subunit alpha
MIFGAAAAGERVFTSSSSPGISLMSEALSFIATAELPAVFVNIVRCGPGLGGILPAQSDYLQAVKGGGHGDYKLIVMAPASVQEAVEMMMSAFPLAEKYRNPVMVLGDGMIGQMMEPVFFPDELAVPPSNKDAWATNGMETRKSEKRNKINTLYLDGESLYEVNLVLKAKYDKIEREEVRYEPYNMDGDYGALVVAYGTMSRVCRTAIDQLKKEGIEVAMIRPQSLYPFPLQAIYDAAGKPGCKLVASIEMSMGQMVEDVQRAVLGQCPVKWFGKAGGLVPTPEEVMDFLKGQLESDG